MYDLWVVGSVKELRYIQKSCGIYRKVEEEERHSELGPKCESHLVSAWCYAHFHIGDCGVRNAGLLKSYNTSCPTYSLSIAAILVCCTDKGMSR